MPKKEKTDPGFDEALKRLEEIVAQMESGEMDLDAMVAAFEEGQRLIRLCSGKLNEVERRIEVLVKDGAGVETAEPFAPPVSVPGE
ncbi:MAG: exodeoxyribonuclease VII small subunit [bacterium]